MRILKHKTPRRVTELLIVVLTALLSSIGFVWSWGILPSLVGLIAAVKLAFVGLSIERSAFLKYCYVYGLVYFAVVMHWMFNIHATELIANSFFALFFKYLTLLIVVSVLAVGFVIAGSIFRYLARGRYALPVVLALPVAWIMGEYLRSILFSVFWLGPGGSVGPYWNFGTVGLLLADTPLKFGGRLVGLYGVSFLVILSAGSIYYLSKTRLYLALILLPILVSGLGYVAHRDTGAKQLTVGAVAMRDGLDDGRNKEINRELAGRRADVVVLPEYSNFFVDSDGKARGNQISGEVDLTIDSAFKLSGEVGYNEIQFRSKDGGLVNAYTKRFLIPGGEYMPFVYAMILFYSGNHDIAQQFNEAHARAPSSSEQGVLAYRGTTYGSLACSGAIAPFLYQELTHSGAEILTNSASIATLGVSGGYYYQALQMADFTAVANARPFVQSARGGPSYIKDKDGRTLQHVADPGWADYIDARVDVGNRRTLYSVLGEWVVWAAATLTLIVVFAKSRVSLLRN